MHRAARKKPLPPTFWGVHLRELVLAARPVLVACKALALCGQRAGPAPHREEALVLPHLLLDSLAPAGPLQGKQNGWVQNKSVWGVYIHKQVGQQQQFYSGGILLTPG